MPQLWHDFETLEDKMPELPYNSCELATNRRGRCAGLASNVTAARDVVVATVTAGANFF